MKKFVIGSLIFSFIFAVSVIPYHHFSKIEAVGETVASVDFSSGQIVSNNMTHFVVTDLENEPYTYADTINGRGCRVIPPKRFAYFDVSPSAVPQSTRNLIIDITYFDQGTDELVLEYNATTSNYRIAYIKKTDSKKWVTTSVFFDKSVFKNGQNNNCDFRLGSHSNDLNSISKIIVKTGSLNPYTEPLPAKTGGSGYSEFKGKTFAGYQGWFGTGGETGKWSHWSKNPSAPAPGNVCVDLFPDVTDYDESALSKPNFANLGSGQETKLFSSINDHVVKTHFDWMREYGIDGVALQRFNVTTGRQITDSPETQLPVKVMKEAERTNRVFYIMYDIAGASEDSFVEDIEFDWVYNIEKNYKLLSSDSYATVDGKPVVTICEFGSPGRPGNPEKAQRLLDFFKSRDCYVIACVSNIWRDLTEYSGVFKNFDAISPWTVGAFKDEATFNDFYNYRMIPDINYCRQNGMDFLPIVFSGFSWSLWHREAPNLMPRDSGNFLWRQVAKLKDLGMDSVYIAMFDEYDEGTAIAKLATDYSMVPADQFFVTASIDGTWLSSDFYLRLAGAATKMLKGEIPYTASVPVPHSEGPVYYRNSFERRLVNYVDGSGTYNLDPCFKNPALISRTNINNINLQILDTSKYSRTGSCSAELSGSVTSNTNASCSYKMADVKIKVESGMTLSYWKFPTSENARYTAVDLLFSDGSKLSDHVPSASPKVAKGETGQWTEHTFQIGQGDLTGKEITQIILSYDKGGTGNFSAHFDDILIETPAETEPCNLVITEISTQNPTPLENEDVSFYAVLRNTGNGPSPAGNHTVALTVDGRDFETAVHLSSIPAGGYTVVNFNKKWKAMVGVRTVRAYVNAGKTIPETNDADNLYARKIKVLYN